MRVAHFCPICGAPTETVERFGRPRPVCTVCDTTVFFDPKVAVVVLVTEGERVLLVQRAHPPAQGKWALPAGFVDPDEAPEAAAQREVAEETGLAVAITALVDVLHRPDPDGLADIVIAYRACVTGGRLLAGDDAAEAAWFTGDTLPPLGLQTTAALLDRWRAEAAVKGHF